MGLKRGRHVEREVELEGLQREVVMLERSNVREE